MSKIIDFLKKKKADAKFSTAGPGHRLNESSRQTTSSQTQPSQPKQSHSSGATAVSLAAATAGSAALKRFENKNNTVKPKSLDTVLEEEKRKAIIEAKDREFKKASEKNLYDVLQPSNTPTFDEIQRFFCPLLDIESSAPLPELMKIIETKLRNNYMDDPLIGSALIIKNCNDSDKIEKCVRTIGLIIGNLIGSKPEDLDKFTKIRKSKIEQKIIDVNGGFDYLQSIGFTDEGEWIVFNDHPENVKEQLGYYLDVLSSSEKFPIELDRKVKIDNLSNTNAKSEDHLSDQFFSLTLEEVKREQQNLTQTRELQETLMTKAMREQLKPHNKVNCKFTRIRFKLSSQIIEATFRCNETIGEVYNWFREIISIEDLGTFDLCFGREVIPKESYSKTLAEMDLVPAATLLIITKKVD